MFNTSKIKHWHHEVYDFTQLSNGQWAAIFFYPNGGVPKIPIDEYLKLSKYRRDNFTRWRWSVGFGISDDKEEIMANFGYRRGIPWSTSMLLKSTGRCGLEGLRWAKNKIDEFCNILSKNGGGEVDVGWEDERRHRAYRYLLKDGFKIYNSYYIKNISTKDRG